MSSDHFRFIMIEIPDVVTIDTIKNAKASIDKLSVEEAVLIDKAIELDTSDVEIEDLKEEDLFHIGKEKLRIKKAMIDFLEEGIEMILLPRLAMDNRHGSVENDRSFDYLEVADKLYAITGDQVSYYSSKANKTYKYLLAINLSKILETL